MRGVKNGTYSSIWHLHGLAGVLGVRVSSVYPDGINVRRHLNRDILPRNQTHGLYTCLINKFHRLRAEQTEAGVIRQPSVRRSQKK